MTAAEKITAAPAAGAGTVVARMRTLAARLPADDGVAVFNRVYLSVTEELAQRLMSGAFEDRRSAADLAARFAELYLDAVGADEAGRPAPACWRPLFLQRRRRDVHRLQFALAGINAHIGHDLPVALLDASRAQGACPEELRSDFDLVGELLAAMEVRVREELMPGPDLLEAAEPLSHLVGVRGLEQAREAAWAAFRVLWCLRGLPDVTAVLTARLGAGVGLAGRLLLTPRF